MAADVRLVLDPATQRVTVEGAAPTVSVLWDEAVQAAIIAESPGPAVGARAMALAHTAIYDAWAAYDPQAEMVSGRDDLDALAGPATDAARTEAMSWAAFTMLADLFPAQVATFEAVMAGLGLSTVPLAVLPGSPAAIGVQVAQALIAQRADDGANQAGGYADTTGYAPVNASPLAILDIARWTPENIPIDPEDGAPEQVFLSPHWGTVTPFALDDPAAFRPAAPEPFFLPGVDATLDVETGLVTFGGQTPPPPVPVTRELVGGVINPGFIAQAERIVEISAGLTDREKLVAEFWEDAAGTAYPPGTWMTFGQYVSARDGHGLAEDAVMFLALSNAVFDASIATWEAKVFHDYARPVRAVRELGALGLIGEPGTDALTGETGHVIEAWAGPGLGTRTILAENFLSFQTPGGNPSPPFAEYTSGHSGFSAAAAEVLIAVTGSDAFGAGVSFEPGSSRFEPGLVPAERLALAWESFTQAADEAGISRLYGGIHFADGDLAGRALGREVGREVWADTLLYVTGAAGEGAGGPQAPAEVLALARLFEAALDRPCNLAGLEFWAGALARGATVAGIAGSFLHAPEFERYFGPEAALEDEDFVGLLLGNLGLGGDAALAGRLAAGLGAGETRAKVLADLAASPEAAAATPYLDALTGLEDGWAYA